MCVQIWGGPYLLVKKNTGTLFSFYWLNKKSTFFEKITSTTTKDKFVAVNSLKAFPKRLKDTIVFVINTINSHLRLSSKADNLRNLPFQDMVAEDVFKATEKIFKTGNGDLNQITNLCDKRKRVARKKTCKEMM